MIRFDYDQLVADFEKDLNETLRSHSARHECLDIWVPTPQINESLEGLIEAALEMNEVGFEILLNEDTINEAEIASITNELKHLAKIEWKKSDHHFVLVVSRSATSTTSTTEAFSQTTVTSSKKTNQTVTPSNRPTRLPNSFRNFLLANSQETRIDPLHNTDNKFAISHKDVQLVLSFTKDKILNGYEVDTRDEILSAFLSLTCQLSIGYPLREIIDHGVNHAIHHLSNVTKHDYKNDDLPTILLPTNLGPEIHKAKILFSDLRNQFGHEIDFTQKNTFTTNVTEKWINFSNKERRAAILQKINEFSKKQGYEPDEIILVEIRNSIDGQPVRIFMQASNEIPYTEHRQIIKKLEIYLKENLEQKLQVYYTENIDENVLRRLGKND